MKKKMTEKDILEYGKQLEGKSFRSEDEAREAMDKMVALLKRVGYTYHRSFGAYSRVSRFQPIEPDTSWFFRKTTSEYGYMEVQVGWCMPKKPEGIFRVDDQTKEDLNPKTGKPWQIGDARTVAGGRIAILTRYGWNTGD